MFLIPKIEKIKQKADKFVLKKKEKKQKPVKAKEVSAVKARQLVGWSFILLVAFSAIGVFRSYTLQNATKGLVTDVSTLKKEAREKKETPLIEIHYPSLEDYAKQFAEVFFTVDGKKKEEREKELSSFCSFPVNSMQEEFTDDFNRVLKDVSVVEVTPEDGRLLVRLRVTYEIQNEVEKEKLVEKDGKKTPQKVKETLSTEKSQEMILPIVENNGKYTVVSIPYFQAVSLAKGQTPMEEIKIENYASLDEKTEKKVLDFLNVFFRKYASAKEEELKLLMKKVELTSGNTEIDSIGKENCTFFMSSNNTLGIWVHVLFTDLETQEKHEERFTLFVTETKNAYEVQKMKHYFTLNEK